MDPRMGAFDAVMFEVESDPVLRSVITVVMQLDQEPDADRLEYRVDRLTRLLPKLRQRAVGNPVSLAPPRWETDPNFDLHYHLTTEELGDGTMDELLAKASRWAEDDFDRQRPLWEMIHYTGLEGGRSALGLKLHHSITDGVGSLAIGAALFDWSADAEDPTDMPDAPVPHTLGWRDRLNQATEFEAASLAHDTVGAAKAVVGAAKEAVTDPVGSAVATQQFMESAGRLLAPADKPMSPIWTERSLSLWFAETSMDFSDLRAAGKAQDATVNDAFMAAVAGALRAYHEQRGPVPDALRVNMPVNRREAGDTSSGNKWIPVRFPVPLNEPDPAKRIRQMHPLLLQAREEKALGVAEQVYKLLQALPQAITTRIAGGMMKGTDFAATNVPGPPIPVFIAGSRVTRMLPFAPKGGAAVNVALLSFNGRAEIAINIDRAAVDDPDGLRECFVEAFKEVLSTVD